MRRVRCVKGAAEIKALRKAALITREIFKKVEPCVRPGVTEKYVAWLIEKERRSYGLRRSFKTIVGSGPNGAIPHAVPSDRRLRNNELVVIDFGVIYKGQHSDMTRTVVLGRPSASLAGIRRAVVKAHRYAIERLRPGLEIAPYVKSVHGKMRAAGFGKYIRHTLGHGVGRRIHEAPKLSERNKRRIKAGMVVTIEPGLYIESRGGVRVEDMVLVTNRKCEVLTR